MSTNAPKPPPPTPRRGINEGVQGGVQPPSGPRIKPPPPPPPPPPKKK